jgi:hypothetical protein
MLQNGWQIIQEAYEKYATVGVTQLLLIGSILILLLKEKKRENQHFVYYVVLVLAIIFFPPVAFLFTKYIDDVYWRVFWLVPSVIIIAFAATKMMEEIRRKSKIQWEFLAIVLLIIVGGKCVYNGENFNKSTNSYKLPQEVIQICEMVAPVDTTRIIVPETIVSYIRQYNPKIDMLYGRNLGKDLKKGKTYELLLQLNSTDPDIQFVAEFAKEKECQYVVFGNTSNGIENMSYFGYEILGVTKNYTVFCEVD